MNWRRVKATAEKKTDVEKRRDLQNIPRALRGHAHSPSNQYKVIVRTGCKRNLVSGGACLDRKSQLRVVGNATYRYLLAFNEAAQCAWHGNSVLQTRLVRPEKTNSMSRYDTSQPCLGNIRMHKVLIEDRDRAMMVPRRLPWCIPWSGIPPPRGRIGSRHRNFQLSRYVPPIATLSSWIRW